MDFNIITCIKTLKNLLGEDSENIWELDSDVEWASFNFITVSNFITIESNYSNYDTIHRYKDLYNLKYPSSCSISLALIFLLIALLIVLILVISTHFFFFLFLLFLPFSFISSFHPACIIASMD